VLIRLELNGPEYVPVSLHSIETIARRRFERSLVHFPHSYQHGCAAMSAEGRCTRSSHASGRCDW
jgi:hypothetical protein